jgi:hypothetical protein
MKTNHLFKKLAALFLPTLLLVGLAGCAGPQTGAALTGTDAASNAAGGDSEVKGIEIGIEPTPTPGMLTYANDFYGFKFEYPETWTLTEKDHGVVLMKGANQLGINFRWTNENFNFDRTGMAAGTPIYRGKVNFMGQVIPQNVVELDHLAKYVIYGQDTYIVHSDDLVFGIVLEDLETDYLALDLPDEVITEAKSILETFARIDAAGSNPVAAPTQVPAPVVTMEVTLDRSVYQNPEYGFTFLYPSHWTVVEEPNKVYVRDERNCQMTIAYRRSGENIQLAETGEQTGLLVPYGDVQFLGQTVGAVLNIQDDLITAAYLGGPGVELGEGTPLRFAISMVNPEGGRLANAQVDSMLSIFESFELSQ